MNLRQKYKIIKIGSILLSSILLLTFLNFNYFSLQSNSFHYSTMLAPNVFGQQPNCDPEGELEQGKTPLSLPPTDIGIDIPTQDKQKLFILKDAIIGQETNIPVCEDSDGMYRLSTGVPFDIKINSKILKDQINIHSDTNNKINPNDIEMKLEGKKSDGILQSLEIDNICRYSPNGTKNTLICDLPKDLPTTIKLNGQHIVVAKSIDDKGLIIISEMSSPSNNQADMYACGEPVTSTPIPILKGDIVGINC